MAYEYSYLNGSNNHQTVLSRNNMSSVGMAFVYGFVAFGILGGGIAIFVMEGNHFLTYLFGGASLVLFGFMGKHIKPSRLPKVLTFDNKQGALLLFDTDPPGTPQSYLPYDQIEGFQVRAEEYWKSAGDGMIPDWRFIVDMTMKDGTFWTLFVCYTRDLAEKELFKIEKAVDLTQPCQPDIQVLPLKGVSESDSPEGVVVSIGNLLPKGRIFVNLLRFLGVAVICFGVRLGYGYETWSNVLLGVVGLFFLIYVFYYYKWMKIQRTVRFLETQIATQGCATYTQRKLRTGQFLMYKKIVGIGFSCRLNTADDDLVLMKENEQEILK